MGNSRIILDTKQLIALFLTEHFTVDSGAILRGVGHAPNSTIVKFSETMEDGEIYSYALDVATWRMEDGKLLLDNVYYDTACHVEFFTLVPITLHTKDNVQPY